MDNEFRGWGVKFVISNLKSFTLLVPVEEGEGGGQVDHLRSVESEVFHFG